MPVIVEKDPTTVDQLSALLPAGSHVVDSSETLHSWLAHQGEEYAVVIGPGVALEEATTLSESLRYTRPSTSVILVRHEVDTDLLYRAMQAGCRDVVRTSDYDGITNAISRAHQLWSALHTGPAAAAAAKPRTGHIITVFSPKGGVGKTTTSVNLALALANKGARKVCLVDLDLAFGDVAITMQLFPAHTIEEAIGGENVIDFTMVESLLTRHEQSLMVLAAPSLPDARDRVTATLVSRMLRTLRDEFDYIVVDTCPNFDEQTLQALDETDDCVVVATLDVPTLKNVKVALETLDLLNIAQGSRHLILNRADDAVGLDPEKVQQILGMPITTMIPSSTDIAAATNAGKPIVISNPSHPASKAFNALATTLAEGVGDSLKPVVPTPTLASARVADHDEAERRGRWRRNKR
ncbi:AAA family ATPase [Nocardioides sp. AE5]|uniref:AAA family ATPase n=1 Tax=Nocardioides sp. AE5 TaxID=2962573 RepID=UPI002882C834|nr:AAA family ATPase [Nocardioides sp. AE5]MDT0201204.1 AAA family ATPase [Nocardioides sp. AE5]